MEKETSIRIDGDGIHLDDAEGSKIFLETQSGKWKAVSACEDVMVLAKLPERPDARAPAVLMAGGMTGSDWIVEVISFIHNSRLTGRLAAFLPGTKRELFFADGMLRMAGSNHHSDLLGEIILREGLITREQLEEALEAQKSGVRLGQLLVARGLLTTTDIYNLLHKKVEKIFFDVLQQEEGAWYFSHDIDLSKLPASIFVDTQALLMEGVKRIDELSYYREMVPRLSADIKKSAAALADCTRQEKAFMRCVDGQKTVEQIAGAAGIGPYETVNIAHRMCCMGLIGISMSRKREEESLKYVVDSYNRLLGLIYEKAGDKVSAAELTRLGQEFISSGARTSSDFRQLSLRGDGRLSYQNMKKIFDSAAQEDRMQQVIRIMSQYLSSILFYANSHLSESEQVSLSEMIFKGLESISAV
jgi:hypothetical protein